MGPDPPEALFRAEAESCTRAILAIRSSTISAVEARDQNMLFRQTERVRPEWKRSGAIVMVWYLMKEIKRMDVVKWSRAVAWSIRNINYREVPCGRWRSGR